MKVFLALSFLLLSNSLFADHLVWQQYGIEKDYPGPFSYESMSRKDYAGITLNVISFQAQIGTTVRAHAKTFEQLTGARINVIGVPESTLYTDIRRGLKSGKYDVAFPLRNWVVDLLDSLEPVPARLLNSPQYQDIASPYDRLGEWNGKTMIVTIDGDKHYLQYRSDLLEDDRYRAEFLAKFGRPLTVPKTWPELNEIASFFHGREIDGKIVYGLAEPTDPKGYLYTSFFKRAAPYAKHPDVSGGFYFEISSMKPQINNPGFVAALEDMIESSNYYPPNWETLSVPDVINLFSNGQLVFADNWDDSFIAAMEEGAYTRNRVKAASSPGSTRTWNRHTQRLDTFATPNQVPFLAEGWTSVVSKNSTQKEVAFDFLGFLSNEANHNMDILIGERGINLYRYSDLDSDRFVNNNNWHPDVADSLTQSFKDLTESQNLAVFLQVNGANEYNRSVAMAVFRALKGQLSAQRALDLTAKKWSELNQSYGVAVQQAAYINTVAVEDLGRD